MGHQHHTSFAPIVNAIGRLLSTLVALAALVGGALLMQVPSGRSLGLEVALLRDSPFTDFRVPGALLLVLIGGVATLSSIAELIRSESAPLFTGLAGITLVGWTVGERILLATSSALEPACLLVGMTLTFLGLLGRVAQQRAPVRDEQQAAVPAPDRMHPAAAH